MQGLKNSPVVALKLQSPCYNFLQLPTATPGLKTLHLLDPSTSEQFLPHMSQCKELKNLHIRMKNPNLLLNQREACPLFSHGLKRIKVHAG